MYVSQTVVEPDSSGSDPHASCVTLEHLASLRLSFLIYKMDHAHHIVLQ